MEQNPETSTKLSILDKLDQNKNELILVDEWKQKLELLVSENPFVEILDSKSYELAKQRKAIFRSARLELRNTGKTPSQESVLIGKINSIKDFVKTTIDELVVIPSTPEEKQSEEVSRWEGIKEAEKAEKERLENERIDAIKNKAVELESSAFEVIQKMTYAGIVVDSAKVSEIMETEFDFEEFDILFTNAFSRVQSALEEKIKDLNQRENDRIAKEKAEKEAAEEKSKSDLQAKRLNELLPYNGYGSDTDMATLWALTDDNYSAILASKKSIKDSYDAKQKSIKEKEESDKKKREEKEEEQKEAIFEIRSKRLEEIEMNLTEHNTFWNFNAPDYIILQEDVYNADVIEFENILSDAKELIKKGKDQLKKELCNARKNKLLELGYKVVENSEYPFVLSDKLFVNEEILSNRPKEWFDELVQDSINHLQKLANEQKEKDLELAKADAAKLKAENKARIKRLADDKNWMSGELEKYFSLAPLEYLTENQETKDFIKSASERIESLKAELLTELKNL